MSFNDVSKKLDEMDTKFDETLAGLAHSRGAVQDVLRVVIPIMKEQNAIIRQLNSTSRSSTDPRLFSGQ